MTKPALLIDSPVAHVRTVRINRPESRNSLDTEVREKLTLSPEQSAALQQDLAGIPGLREYTVVSTCNRIEIYGVGASSEVSGAAYRMIRYENGIITAM